MYSIIIVEQSRFLCPLKQPTFSAVREDQDKQQTSYVKCQLRRSSWKKFAQVLYMICRLTGFRQTRPYYVIGILFYQIQAL